MQMQTLKMTAALGALIAWTFTATACEEQSSKVKPSAKIHRAQPITVARTPVKTQPTFVAPDPSVDQQPATETEPKISFDEAMKQAGELVEQGEREQALARYRQAALLQPENVEPQLAIARMLLGQREPEAARPHAEQSVKLAPERSSAWNTLGRVELMQGKLEAAVKAFEEATVRNGNNIYAWNNLGLTRIKQQRWEEAAKALERATSGDKPEAYMFNNLGIAYEHLDRIPEAMVSYKSGLSKGSGIAGQNFVRLEQEQQDDELLEEELEEELDNNVEPTPEVGSVQDPDTEEDLDDLSHVDFEEADVEVRVYVEDDPELLAEDALDGGPA